MRALHYVTISGQTRQRGSVGRSAFARGIGLVRMFRRWRERNRQRGELMSLIRDEFACKDMGITSSLALREVRRFPWQPPDREWQEIACRRRNEYSGNPEF